MADKLIIQSSSETKFVRKYSNHKWIIDRQGIEAMAIGKRVVSTTFNGSVHKDCPTNWSLILEHRINQYNVEVIAFKLELINGQNVCIETTLSIINANNEFANKLVTNRKYQFNKSGEQKELYSIGKNYLLAKDLEHWFSDNKLSILVEISQIYERITTSTLKYETDLKDLKETEIQLIVDLSALFVSQKGWDVVLETNNKEFKAHKAILMARSEYFSAMFTNETEESLKNRVVITDIDSEVIHAMLVFIYTGKVIKLKELGPDLLAAADKYGLDQLKAICEESLLSVLTIENAIQVLLLSDSLKPQKLKFRSKEFIGKHIQEVMETQDWKTLMASNPDLINEIILSIKQNP